GVAPDHTALYQIEQDRYVLSGDRIEVPLTWTDASGITVRKTITLYRGAYTIDVRHQLRNDSGAPWAGPAYRQLQRVPLRTGASFSFTDATAITFHGPAWYSPEERYEKQQFDDVASTPLRRDITAGWAGMLQHYFLAAWIPPADQANRYE